MVEIIRGALGTKEGGSLPQGLWQTEQIRALERNWAAREGQPLYALMERAGAALRCAPMPPCIGPTVAAGGSSSAPVITAVMAMCWPALPARLASRWW